MTWKDILKQQIEDILKGDYKGDGELNNMLDNSGLPINMIRQIKELIYKIENEHLKDKDNLEAKNKELEARLKEWLLWHGKI